MKSALLWLRITENPLENKDRRVGWWFWIIENAGEPEIRARFDRQASSTKQRPLPWSLSVLMRRTVFFEIHQPA
jgi:hypothetical protein